MLKRIFSVITFIAIFFLSTSNANADVVFSWAKQMGGTGGDIANSMIHDSTDNVYTIGNFADTVDFDPGAGTSNLVSAGGTDIFVSKLDSSGNFVWVKQIGGTGADLGRFITLDSLGNVYITGQFEDTVDFDPGAGTSNLVSAGSSDIFVSKLDSSGNFVWAKQIGGTNTDVGKGIALDASSNVYTVGDFLGTADFDPGAGTSNLVSAVGADIFVSKLDSSGNFVWAQKMGGTLQEFGSAIFLDSSGSNVYTTGHFNGTADFDPGAGTSNLVSAGGTDIFVSKLDSSGNFVWAKKMGSTSADVANAITLDSSDNIYATGSFTGTVDFDPGAGTSNLVSAGGTDIFVSKLDSSGNFVSAQKMGGTLADVAYAITLDSSDNIYTTGNLTGTADFDPGAGTSNLVSAGSTDIFVSKLDSSGNFVWAKKMGGTGADIGRSVSIDSNVNTYVAGQFSGTADFDPGAGTSNLVSAGGTDIFVSKLSLDTTPPTIQTLSPADGAIDIAVASNLVITFDEIVNVGTGNISIYKSSDDSLVEAIDVTGGLVTGTGTTTITINPTSNLIGGPTDYYVQIDATAFDDTSGNSFAGILDETTWNFTTVDATAPTISETTPVSTPGTSTTPSYTFTSDEAGDITYGGSCVSATTTAVFGANTIIFNTLALGTYADCTITVTDSALNASNLLAVTSFSIVAPPSGGGSSGSRRKVISHQDNIIPSSPILTPSPVPTFVFLNNLSSGVSHPDVKELQKYLNTHGFPVALSGPGSLGNETNKFGALTKAAVIKFQIAKSIKPAVGFFGPITRGIVNSPN